MNKFSYFFVISLLLFSCTGVNNSCGYISEGDQDCPNISVITEDDGKACGDSLIVKTSVLSSAPIEAIDLGLSVKWASCNVGARTPEEYGDYYAWGEIEPHYATMRPIRKSCNAWRGTVREQRNGYSWLSYKWANGEYDRVIKYCSSIRTNYWDGGGMPDNKIVLENSDDVAYVKNNGKWRMPTDSEWTELRTRCTWTWTTKNGVKGRLVTALNGNSVFLPAAGYMGGTRLHNAGTFGYYWSSSLYPDYPNYAWYVYFFSAHVGREYFSRCYGRSIRPVSD